MIRKRKSNGLLQWPLFDTQPTLTVKVYAGYVLTMGAMQDQEAKVYRFATGGCGMDRFVCDWV